MTKNSTEKKLEALIAVGKELASTIDLDALLHRLLAITSEVFGFDNAIIRLLDDKGERLVTAAACGYPSATTQPPILLGQGIMGRVAVARSPLLVPDVTLTPDYVPGIDNARSELAVPMLVGERLIGVLNLESPRPHAFSEADIAPLMTMAGQAAIAIENARLYENLRSISHRYQNLHQFNESILNSASIGIYAVDADLVITSWNRKMDDLSGVSEEEALGRKLFSLFPSLDAEGFGERVRRVLHTGQPERLRLTHRNLKGELRFQKRRLTPLLEKGETVGVVVLVEDVTEFRQLLEQTIQGEKLAEVGRLSAALAHEINNPLAVIIYAAQLLLREEELSGFQRELADRVESEAERLKTLTGSLLSFSRTTEMRRREIDLNEVLRDVLRLIRFESSRKGILLEEVFGEIPAILADANRLKQVFINLAMNALQALSGGGTLRVATEAGASGKSVRVFFTDNGPGIPRELQEKIFEPFFTTKKEGEGTGLGLYICRNIVMEHEGKMTLESSPGRGTRFCLEFPVA
ncbi:MAG: hypothetical protein A2091_04595 [Desulfuromonadales bacterium GWD2_61_12]|nr:MAG: hypothetical protein A2091_04595 [Desulfuromonadales bacterium GWD2_61_12]